MTERTRTKKAPTESRAPRTPGDELAAERTPAKGAPIERTPAFFLNRELTWLNFNFRVLNEAEDERTPLLERIKFASIVGSNLDEFFQKRIGGLKQQVGAGLERKGLDGRTPQQQIVEASNLVRELEGRQRVAIQRLMRALEKHDVHVTTYDTLPKADQAELRDHYLRNIFPLVTPQATDPAHPFPFVSNLSLNLLVTLHHPGDATPLLARAKVPIGAGVPRYLRLGGRDVFVTLESVMAANLDLLFPGMEIDSAHLFRVTRNANADVSEEHADDLLAQIETGLRDRKFAPVVRLEVSRGTPKVQRGMLAAELGLHEQDDVFEVDGMMAPRHLMQFMGLKAPELKDPSFSPADHPALVTDRNIFHTIRDRKHILIHQPYQSFATSVERFLREASTDPKVRAIKMTIYRTSEDAKIIQYLIDAARNGKQVAVVVELKARFDEAANIQWARRLEHAGIHVTYGVMGLKTHCKAILVVRQDYDILRRYAHIGTGNYHSGTARLYCDLGILTSDETIGHDFTELFNYLTTGYKQSRTYNAILPAPKIMKPMLLEKIAREVEHQKAGHEGHIQFKINALTDADVIKALYAASRDGVRVDLMVRDSCMLRPGIEGLSETIRVVSLVGRFLEHARIYYFRNRGEEEYYIGSADAMKRNLEDRVEVLGPVQPLALRDDLRMIMDLQLGDRRGAWDMQPDGSYVQRQPGKDDDPRTAQARFVEIYEDRMKSGMQLRRRSPRGVGERNLK